MTISFGVPGYSVPFHERVTMLVEMVGGLGKAADLAGVNPDTVNNWRKAGARVPILGVLPLAIEAGVSLDWVATGFERREDLLTRREQAAEEAPAMPPSPGFVQLLPVEPATSTVAGRPVERWVPSEVSLSADWLHRELGLPAEAVRYARLDDDGMAPLLARGAVVLVDSRPQQQLRSGLYLVKVAEHEWLARRLLRLPDGRATLTADAQPNWVYELEPGSKLKALPIVWVGQKL